MTGRGRAVACAAIALVVSMVAPNSALAATSVTVSPNPITISNVEFGATGSLQLTITNTGNIDDETVVSSVNNPDFSVSGACDSATLTPSATCMETISFTPSALGPATATVTVEFTNQTDSTTADVQVPVNATAV